MRQRRARLGLRLGLGLGVCLHSLCAPCLVAERAVAQATPAPAAPSPAEDATSADEVEPAQSRALPAPASAPAPTPEGPPATSPVETSAPVEGESQRIYDPELDAVPPAPASEDGRIYDPELDAAPAATQPSAVPSSLPPPAELRALLRTRLALDVAWDDPREDVFEALELGLIEARVRRSDRLSFTVGVLLAHRLRTREQSTLDAGAVRTEIDVAPTAAHVDATLADPLHLRAGYQSVFLGRFDALSGVNVLARYDLRGGPSTLPELSEISQPALWLDLTPTQGLELRAIYVPFFAPHRFDAFDGDYALAPSRQADIDAALEGSAMDEGLADAETLGRALRATVSRSGMARSTEGTFSAFAPDETLAHPQAAVRAVWHGPLGELALTGATALEHLPVLELADATRAPDEPLVQTRYDRLWVAGIDGALAIGPVQLGLELAAQRDRVMFVLEQGELARAERTNVLHGGLRAELLEGDTWLFAVEGAIELVLDDLDPGERYAFSFDRRFLPSAVAFVACDLAGIGLKLELGGGVAPGLTYSILPRIEQELSSGLYLELGAVVLGGGGSRALDRPAVSLGAVYEDTDHVYTGLKLVL